MIRYHVYCDKCLKYLGFKEQLNDEIICECSNRRKKIKAKYFIIFDLKKQFQQFPTIPNIVNKLR